MRFLSRPAVATLDAAGSSLKEQSSILELFARAGPRSISGHRPAASLTVCSRRERAKSLLSTSATASWLGRSETIHESSPWKKRMRDIFREQEIPEPIEICVIDVSFISLTLILPNAFELLTPDGVILALIKPQFELARCGREPRRDCAIGRVAREGAAEDRRFCSDDWRGGGGPDSLQHRWH